MVVPHGLDSESFFKKMVDELVEFSEYDPELKESFAWIEEQAFKKGVSTYDFIYELLYAHEVKEKAKKWLKEK